MTIWNAVSQTISTPWQLEHWVLNMKSQINPKSQHGRFCHPPWQVRMVDAGRQCKDPQSQGGWRPYEAEHPQSSRQWSRGPPPGWGQEIRFWDPHLLHTRQCQGTQEGIKACPDIALQDLPIVFPTSAHKWVPKDSWSKSSQWVWKGRHWVKHMWWFLWWFSPQVQITTSICGDIVQGLVKGQGALWEHCGWGKYVW